MKKESLVLIFLFFIFSFFLLSCQTDNNGSGNNNDDKPNLSVEVSSYKMTVGDTEKIEPILSGTDKEFTILYSSENLSVATIDDNGNILAVNYGETTVVLSLKDYPDITATVTIIVEKAIPEETLTLTGPDVVYVSQTIQLIAFDYYSDDNSVIWESKTPAILKVDQNGSVTGLQNGEGIIRIISWANAEWVEKHITVIIPEPESVEIVDINRRITYSTSLKLSAKVLPEGAEQEVTWSSSDGDICMIDEEGYITPIKPGEVLVTATIKDGGIQGMITLKVEPTLMEVLTHYNNDIPLVQTIKVFGASNYDHQLIGSVNNYLNTDLVIIESILSPTAPNRPGTIKSSIKYITVHDTGNSSVGAGASAHNSFIKSTTSVSWHYTVGNDGIYHHIPDNEVAWHSGDGTTDPYVSYDSGILYTDKKKPEVTITPDGYYALDGVKSLVAVPRKPDDSVPKTSEINALGIEVTKGSNGNWHIGKTYWNNAFKRVSNRGGNLNSIGIESCVDKGSDIFLTWQLLAKLVAKLLEENGLGLEHVVQHHYFAGKDCPMTMRRSNNFKMFLRMVEVEYIIRTMYKDYKIEISSDSPYIDNRGRITSLPVIPIKASYNVKVTNNITKQMEQKTFYVNLPSA